MKFRGWSSVVITLLAALAITLQLSAQDNPNHKPKHHQYKLIDVGTFGGPNTYFPGGPPQFRFLNTRDAAVGVSATSVPDPYYPYCLVDCYLDHTFQWKDGVLTDMGALPGSNGSAPFGINDWGAIVGVSENGSYDPNTGYPIYRGVIWYGGEITDIGTLGGNNAASNGINNWGQVVGGAQNAIPDPYASGLGPCVSLDCWPSATQIHAFLWQHGAMTDLGTLGGNDSAATLVNDLGQIAGVSYTNTTPNGTTGLPTQDPFFWDHGKMMDIGTLGGTFGYPYWMNQHGQVTGWSNLAGDASHHAFLWDRGKLTDLGTLGGSYSGTFWINDLGEATGYGALTGDFTYHAVLWKNGKAKDLGTLSGYPRSTGVAVNNREQVVGNSATPDFSVLHGFLWENGGPMIDLNTFVPAGSGITIQEGDQINDDGVIGAHGTVASGNQHVFVLIPFDLDSSGGGYSKLSSTVGPSTDSVPHLANPSGQPKIMFGQGPLSAN